jgi:glycosyltransferase involved in cell wall biosynthesis
MKIIHTISSMGINSGGPALSTFLTVKGLRDKDVSAEIATYQVSEKSDKLISSEDFIHVLSPGDNKFAYSKHLKTFLLQNKQYNIFHSQGVWQYPTYITAKIARKLNKPYIITPRGMLYPQDLAKGKLKKSIFLKLFLLNDLQKATCIHATCIEEMEHLRNLEIASPIAVIPNPIDIADIEKPVKAKTKLRVGYLGRVHPRKNIERLIYAWHQLRNDVNHGELVIIGDGDKQYLDFLKQESKRLQLNNVVFTGFLSGNEKEKTLNSLSFLVVPSDFENFGNIVTEALVKGIPVIASKGTPWRELNTHRCGWWIDNDIDTIAKTLKEAIALSKEEYQQMGVRGRALMKNNYSIEIVAQKMMQLYQWILKQGTKPEFVHEY